MGDTFEMTRFTETLAEYIKYTSRTLTSAINTKAYYVARKAVWFTGKTDKGKMQKDLGGFVRVQRTNKKGKLVTRRQIELTGARDYNAPLAAVIINKRRGLKKQSGLYGRQMAVAIRKMLSARLRSVAFIKSGWLPAIQALAPFAEKKNEPDTDRDAAQVGNAKGRASEARESDLITEATIVNLASAVRDKKNALEKYGIPGLDQAFNDEAQSMAQYIEDRMKPDADRFNAQQR